MKHVSIKETLQNNKFINKYAAWILSLVLAWGGAVLLVYYWRVFYYYGQYPFAHIPPNLLTLIVGGVATLAILIAFLMHTFTKDFCKKYMVFILFIGMLFVFVTPPLQIPDETEHFLRITSISNGKFDFDAKETYSEDVEAFVHSFGVPWTNSRGGSPIKARSPTEDVDIQPEEAVSGEAIANRFALYQDILNGTQSIPEDNKMSVPYSFMIIPFLPQALFAFIARLIGFGALGTMYAARIGALITFCLLGYAALKNCDRYKIIFVSLMALPITLFMAASCSYDSILIGLYFYCGSFLCKKGIKTRDIVFYLLAVIVMTSVKINNIIFLLPLLLCCKDAFATKLKKWHIAALCIGSYSIYHIAKTMFNTAAIKNYGIIGRIIEGSSQGDQIAFMLENPLRTIAVFYGTLYENQFFISDMGLFGHLDTPIYVIGVLSPIVLAVCAMLSVQSESSHLNYVQIVGILLFAAMYVGAVVAGLYVTYTPVSMSRVIGLQFRYFIPPLLMALMALCALLNKFLTANGKTDTSNAESLPQVCTLQSEKRALNVAVCLSVVLAVIGVILMFETYFVGPVAIAPFNN